MSVSVSECVTVCVCVCVAQIECVQMYASELGRQHGPAHSFAVARLAASRGHLAHRYALVGDVERAVVEQRECVTEYNRLVLLEDTPDAWRELAVAVCRLACLYERAGMVFDAVKTQKESIRLRRRAHADDGALT